MGLIVRSTRVACPTGTGTQDITISGFGTPKAAMLTVVRATTDGTAANHAVMGWGITDGTRNISQTYEDEHGLDTSDTYRSGSASSCVVIMDSAADGVIEGEAAFSAWITDGIRINWTDAPTAGYLLVVTLFGGSDLTAYANEVNLGTGTSAIDNTDPAMVCDVLITGFRTGTAAGGARLSFGLAHFDRDSTIVQCSVGIYAQAGQGTSVLTAYLREDAALTVANPPSEAFYVTVSDFDANGFSATPSANTAASRMVYLALNLGADAPVVDAKVYTYTTPTATGSNTDSAPNFTPQFDLYFTSLCEAAATFYTDNRAGSIGVSVIDAAAQYHSTVASEDGADTTNTQSLSNDQVFDQPDDDGTIIAAATLTSLGSTGPVFSYSTAPATAKKWIALAIEAEAGGGGSTYEDALTLARTAGISQINNIIADAGISLARTNDSAPGNVITGEASLTLAQVLAIAQVAQADRAGSLSLPKNMTIAQASQLDANSALTLGTILTVGLIGGLNVEDALTLARTMDIAAVNIITKEDALTLARSLGITQITQLDAVGTLPLGKIIAVTHASQLEGVADLALARRLAAAFTNVANLNSAVSLGLSLSAVMVASVFSGGLVTPAARVYVIPAENRVLVIDAENRIYIIDAENRTFEI